MKSTKISVFCYKENIDTCLFICYYSMFFQIVLGGFHNSEIRR